MICLTKFEEALKNTPREDAPDLIQAPHETDDTDGEPFWYIIVPHQLFHQTVSC